MDRRVGLQLTLSPLEVRFIFLLVSGYNREEVMERLQFSKRQYGNIKTRIQAKLIDAGVAHDEYLWEIRRSFGQKAWDWFKEALTGGVAV